VLAAFAPARSQPHVWLASFSALRAQHDIGIGPVLRIEERIAADRHRRIGLDDLAELHSDITLARMRAHRLEIMRTPILGLGATSYNIARIIEGTPAITIISPIQKPDAPDILLTSSASLGMRLIRRRASFISAPVVFIHLCRMTSVRGPLSIGA